MVLHDKLLLGSYYGEKSKSIAIAQIYGLHRVKHQVGQSLSRSGTLERGISY